MPIAPKNQRNKGYLLPEVIDPEENICICVPIPKDWGHIRAFLGQLTELSKWQAWEKDGTTNASLAARRWFDIATCVAEEIDCAMAENGCGCNDTPDFIYRHNPETDRLERSGDGGETWENAPDPRYDSPVFEPQSGETEDEIKCLSATNATIYFRDELMGQATEWTTLTTVIAGILTVLVGLLTGGLGAALVITLASTFIGAGIGAAIAAFTTEVYDRFQCNLYCHALPDGSWDEAALVAIKAKIDVDETGVANTILKGWIDQLGTVGLTNSGRLHIENDADCSDCACADCSNLDNWAVIYGTILEQTPGYIRLSSVDNGLGQQSCRIANWGGAGAECCAVTYNIITGVATNQAYYPCGSSDPVFSVPPPETCLWDVNVINVFNAAMEVEFTFTECP